MKKERQKVEFPEDGQESHARARFIYVTYVIYIYMYIVYI